MQNTAYRQGFTLIETLLAIAISAIVMASVATFLVSVTQVYARESFLNARDEHISGIRSFLRESIAQAPIAPTHSGDESGSDQSLALTFLPGEDENESRFLRFYVRQPNPVLNYGPHFPAGTLCYLDLRNPPALDLYWRPDLLPLTEDESRPGFFKKTISTALDSIRYLYYRADEERWDNLDQPERDEENNSVRMPDFIVLRFQTHDESTKAVRIGLPGPNSHPLFL